MTHGKVLILDDNASFAETLAAVLEHHQFDTQWSHNPGNVRGLAERVPPDVLIIDYGLGFQTGIEIASALISVKLVKKIIVLTGWTEITEKDLPSQLAENTILLHKPVDIDVLVAALEKLIA